MTAHSSPSGSERGGSADTEVRASLSDGTSPGKDLPPALPIAGMRLTPYGWPAMAGAYMGLLQFLIRKQEARDAFKAETGMDIERGLGLGVSPLARMVDKATGYDKAVVAAFADWVTEFHWGDDNAPAVDLAVELDDNETKE